MRGFHVGLVSGYERRDDGIWISLDTGVEAVLPLDRPVPEKFLSGDFGLGLFARNHGLALSRDAGGRAVWHPAYVCTILLGASFRKEGRMLGMEHWQAGIPPDQAAAGAEVRPLGEGAISLSLAASAAPFHLYSGTPGYEAGAALVKEAVKRLAVSHQGELYTSGNADRGIVRDLQGEDALSMTLARIDFVYNLEREVLHVQKTRCPDKVMAAGRRDP